MRGTHCSGSTDNCNRDSSISIVTGLWGGQIGVRFRAGRTELRLLQNVNTDFGSHQPSYSTDTGFFPGGKAAGARCDPSTPSSAEVKNECSYSQSMRSWRGEGQRYLLLAVNKGTVQIIKWGFCAA